MKILIVTGGEPHHRYFCSELAKSADILRIVRPRAPRRSRLDLLAKRYRRNGWFLTLSHYLSSLGRTMSGWSGERESAIAVKRYLAGGVAEFDQRKLDDKCVDVENINSARTAEMIADLAPDVTFCLGGPVYRSRFLKANRVVVNYHSGLSPVYNGSETIRFAFANGHPHLCGGTLMVMNEKVDGGDILGHFLPAIEDEDNPATLFAKGIVGAAAMATEFLGHYEKTGTFTQVAQPGALFYYRAEDRGLHQTHTIARNIRKGLCALHRRDAEIVRYWDERDQESARRKMREKMEGLMFPTT